MRQPLFLFVESLLDLLVDQFLNLALTTGCGQAGIVDAFGQVFRLEPELLLIHPDRLRPGLDTEE